jgi:hypothetical protein
VSVPRSVAEVIREHVTLEVEGIDRMYLNVYQPKLQHDRGVVSFFRYHRGQPVVSSALMEPISKAFIKNLEAFVQENDIPLVSFAKDQRKDDVAAAYRARFPDNEGVLFVGKAQEKVAVFRTEKRTNADTGKKYPWIVKSTAMVNQFYFYAVDEDFGPFFLKFSSYFPYNAKLCLNGHEYVKRQLAKEGILPLSRWTMAFFPAPSRSDSKNFAPVCRPARSTPCCASGWRGCPILLAPPTAPPATATTCPRSKPSFP